MLINKIHKATEALLNVGYILAEGPPKKVLVSFQGISYLSVHSPLVNKPFRYKVEPKDNLYKGVYDVEGSFILENITKVSVFKLYVQSLYREAKIKEEFLNNETVSFALDQYLKDYSQYRVEHPDYFFAVPLKKSFLDKGLTLSNVEENSTLRFSYSLAQRAKHLPFSEYDKNLNIVYTNTPHIIESIYKYFLEEELRAYESSFDLARTLNNSLDTTTKEAFKVCYQEVFDLKNKLEELYQKHNS